MNQHHAKCGCAEGAKVAEADRFSQLVRDKGALAAQIETLQQQVTRLEELLASSRAQAESLLQQRIVLEGYVMKHSAQGSGA